MPLDGYQDAIARQQAAFASAVLWCEDDVPAELTGPGGPASARRFGVYRNNVAAGLTRCLAARFPVVERLVGEEFFLAMARLFVEANPPTSPALIAYGEEFAEFLATFAPVAAIPYLPDVARLEWRMSKAYHSPDARPVAATHLATLGEAAIGAQLTLHPSVALLISRYPIFSIWQTNARDANVRPIDASAAGEAVLIVRPRFDVAVTAIDTPTYAFTTALAAGHSLEVAADVAVELDGEFDVGAALQLLFVNGAIAGIQGSGDLKPAQAQPARTMSCAT